METPENEQLHTFTVDLSRKVTEISDKIKNQSLILESIGHQAKNNDQSFKKNQDLFSEALIKLDKDKRNMLIIILIFIIIILLYILKN